MKRLIAVSPLIIAISSCASDTSREITLRKSNDQNSSLGMTAPVDHEYAHSKFDNQKYLGIRCGEIMLGTSLAKFKDEIDCFPVAEETKFPSFLKKYSTSVAPPIPGMSWSPVVKFVDDGLAYRLYTVEGLVTEAPQDLVQRLCSKYGKYKLEGFAHVWAKGGTKLRLIEANDQVLLSFTDDKLIDLSTQKMSEQLDLDASR